MRQCGNSIRVQIFLEIHVCLSYVGDSGTYRSFVFIFILFQLNIYLVQKHLYQLVKIVLRFGSVYNDVLVKINYYSIENKILDNVILFRIQLEFSSSGSDNGFLPRVLNLFTR